MVNSNKLLTFTVALLCLVTIQPPLSMAGEKLVIGHSLSVTATLTIIAKTQGYYVKEGLDVELRNMRSGTVGVAAMLADEIDVSESPVFSLVANGFKRNDYRIFTTTAVYGNDNQVVARKDRGINSVRDLKKKKVGTLKGGLPHYVLGLMLTKAGLAQKDVTIVLDEADNLSARLKSGELDAVCLYGGWIDMLKQSMGENAVIIGDKNLLRVTGVQAAKREKLEKNPALFTKLLKAYIRAEEFVKKNPDLALKIVVDELKMDLTQAKAIWKPNLVHIGLDQSLVVDMENIARWQIESGLQNGQNIPNYLNFINFTLLEKINPARVTIEHAR